MLKPQEKVVAKPGKFLFLMDGLVDGLSKKNDINLLSYCPNFSIFFLSNFSPTFFFFVFGGGVVGLVSAHLYSNF